MKNLKFVLCIVTFFSVMASASVSEFDLPNFAKISDSVYRGGRPTDTGLNALNDGGIKTVISLQGGDLENYGLGWFFKWWEPGETPESIAHEQDVVQSLGMQFVNIPLNSIAPGWAISDAKIDAILEIMSDPNHQPVFIHCERGVDRSGLLIALYRVKYENWTTHQAYTEWFNAGHDNIAAVTTGGLDEYFFKRVKQFEQD